MIKVMIATLISLMSFAPIMAQNIKGKIENTKASNPQLSSSASFLRLNVLSSLN